MAEDFDLESMVEGDVNLEEFEEVGDFVDPPNGRYIFQIVKGEVRKFENDDGQEFQNISITNKILKTVELSDQTEPPVADGSLVVQKFKASKEGIGKFRTFLRKVFNSTTPITGSFKDIFQALEGEEWEGIVSHGTFKDRTFLKLQFLKKPQ